MKLRRNLIIACVCLLSACGGTTSTAPSQTPDGPTPTPVDVEKAFLDAVTDNGFSASGTITGSAAIGTVPATIDGTFMGDANAFEQILTVTAAGVARASDRIVKTGGGWERFGDGPWLALPAPAEPPIEATSLFAWLRTLTDLEKAGLDTRGETAVARLTTLADAPPVPPEAIGFDTADVTTPEITVSLFASSATGAPVAIDVDASWTQVVLGAPTAATYMFSYAFSDASSPVTIDTPTDVWTLNVNDTLGYQIAMPEGWTGAASGDRDVYSLDGVPTVFVRANANARGLTLDEFRAAITATYQHEFGAPQSVTASTLDGVKANHLKYGVSASGGTPHALIDRIAMHGSGWEVSMVTPAGVTSADEDLFETFCASFAFTK
jgi:hypothetical protein